MTPVLGLVAACQVRWPPSPKPISSHVFSQLAGNRVCGRESALEVVGIAKVSKTAYQDPTTDDNRWVAVDIVPFKTLKKPVALKIIKTDSRLKDIALVRIGRLSVMPLTKTEFDVLIELSSAKTKSEK